jgi:PilZ domain
VVRSWQDERVPVNLDVRVWGIDANGHAFSQRARTHNISKSGALLCNIEHEPKIGDTIGVQASQSKTRCKVVWVRNTGSLQKIQIGVQLLSKMECPWTSFLPDSTRDGNTVTSSARRWPRHKIDFAIALRDERTVFRLTATDVSGSGCYVEMLSPFPIGTALDAELWLGTEKVATRALVRTCDPRVGMGIEFVGLKSEDQKRFQDYLRAINPFGCSIEYQNPKSTKGLN